MNLKTKDYIFIGMITIISLVVYMIAMAIASLGGVFGHSISTGVFGLLAGVIFVFICYRYPKRGIFTIYTIVLLLFFSLMGGAYLPWFVTSAASAIAADIILNYFGYNRLIPQMIAWSFMQLGSAAGAWVPIWFFAESYRQEWIERGQSAASMDASIGYATGMWGIISAVSVFLLSCVGVFIGRSILKKYQPDREG